MRILSANQGLLTFTEVAHLLETQKKERDELERQERRPNARRRQPKSDNAANVHLIGSQIAEYVESEERPPQSREQIADFLDAVAQLPFELTRVETLMLIDMRPSTIIEIHLIVEECEERLDRDQRRELLHLCRMLNADDPE